jgi:SH3 domain-containing protein
MRGLLPSVWLLLAGLYTASLITLLHPFSFAEDWPTPPPLNETVRAKEPRHAASPAPAEAAASPFRRVPLVAPVAPKGAERQDQWARIGGYTTVARGEPTTAAPVLFAYTPGLPLRVIAREGGFAHVQDLGSGQYGWVKENALAPFTGGDGRHEDVAPQPRVVASAAPASALSEPVAVPKAVAPPAPVAKAVVVAAKKLQPPRGEAARSEKEVAAAEPEQRGLFGFRRNRPQRIALSGDASGFAGIINRAFGGR